jgi:hypothetical protein
MDARGLPTETRVIKDDRTRLDNFVKQVWSEDGRKLEVGVFDDGSVNLEGEKLIDVAMWLHEGTKTIPSRPFITSWFERNELQLDRWFERASELLIEGRQTWKQNLNWIGLQCVQGILKDIQNRIYEANAPSTAKKKGFDYPLLEHGNLIAAIRSKVE